MTLKDKWKKFNEDYEEITKEVASKGFSTVGNLVFFPLFVFGFIYVKNIGDDNFDIKTPFEIVFNWGLTLYSLAVSLIALFLYLFSKNIIFKGLLTRSFETTLSLFFICLAGFTMRVVDLPFLDRSNIFSFIFLTELLVFLYIWGSIKLFVQEDIPKKENALFIIKWVSVVFFLSLIASVIIPLF